ncbi:DUF962 domain-containing protein [Rhizobacter sp. Root1221]|uniref:Mpo1 family 2-hydroxy fatty acid dioxygenase n=1 Tax=Rhizobacter sp. Root1221 TaxID=1736433 RepID=UPI000B2800CF|nr:Mpo1-like protein [Rhizobacter sp. Root1221]
MSQARTSIELLSQYAVYHRDQRNIATHFIGVPMIVFGIGVLLARARFDVSGVAFSAAWLAFALSAIWYLTRRGQFVLSMAVTAAVGVLIAAAHGVSDGSVGGWLAWGVGSFLVGWVVQFIGHYYEGRKPAFVDDLVGLLVGPMFVTAEALFELGWNKPLLAEIERRAGPTHLRNLVM